MDRELSMFAGAAGRVLWGAVSLRSLASGLALGFVLLVGDGMLIYSGADALAIPFTQVVLAVALARFVLNGQFGEWEGSLFSAVGGSWNAMLLVAARYLALTMIWLVPLLLLGLSVGQAPPEPWMVGRQGSVLMTLYVFGATLTPPLFLIASVAASDFGELFSTSHWRRLFEGRLADLASIYAVYLGGVGLAFMFCYPIVMLGFLAGWQLGALLIGLAGCFLSGLAVNLLGRLCGFFALGDFATQAEAEPTVPPAPESGDDATPGEPLPALLDAAERIPEIMRRFETDPNGALGALEDLRGSFAPHPQVQVALCICRRRAGEVDEALSLAHTVLPICFERGHVQLAGRVFKELRHEVQRLELTREQVLIVGDALMKKDDLAGAGAAYSTAIGRDRGETRAINGLLQVAEAYLGERGKPSAAIKVYEYLITHCSTSPFAEQMYAGLDKCRRQTPQPIG